MRLIAFYLCIFFFSHAFSQNLVYLANADGTVSVLDADNNHAPIAGSPFTAVSLTGPGPMVSIVISPDGRRAYVPGWFTSNDIAAFDINPNTGALTHISGSPFSFSGTAPFGAVVSPDSTKVYVTFAGTNEISLFDADMSLIGTVPTPGSPHGIAIHPNGTKIYAVYTDLGLVAQFDSALTPIGAPVSSGGMNPGNTPYFVAVSPSGSKVYVTNASSSEIALFDDNLAPITNSTSTLLGPIGISVNQSETIVYVANTGNSTVSILDANTLMSVAPSLSSEGNNCYITKINPTGTLLYTTNGGSSPTPLSVRDVSNGYTPIAGSPFPSSTAQYGIAFTLSSSPSGPRNLTGRQKKNDFGVIYELYNSLRWDPSLEEVTGYYVYRNGTKIATLSSSTFEYQDHNREKGVSTLYSVTSFDVNGNESSPISVVIQ